MLTLSRASWFYSFSGAHTFLLGLFPFFAPIFLWKSGASLSVICLTISLVGLSFLAALRLWDWARTKASLRAIMFISFLLEWFLIFSGFWIEFFWFWWVFGVIFGAYNAWFWLTQRFLFLGLVDLRSSGNQYGNLQIFAFIILKIAILLGAFLFDTGAFFWLFLISSLSSLAYTGLTFTTKTVPNWPEICNKTKRVTLRQIITFKDDFRSRFIFLLDGPFLFFESWFWTLSLFHLTDGNFLSLGLLVVGISVIMSFIFWALKKTVDERALIGKSFYIPAVLLYALSWLFRSLIEEINNLTLLGITLVSLMFFTAYFRLLFNKKIYDIASDAGGCQYLILKSYYSQFSLGFIFAALGLNFYFFPQLTLSSLYGVAGIVSLGYLGYNLKKTTP